jgi:hypothetical protein
MSQITTPSVAACSTDSHATVSTVMTELTAIAEVIERVGEVSDPTVELLEASRAVHNALVYLSGWSGTRKDAISVASPEMSRSRYRRGRKTK